MRRRKTIMRQVTIGQAADHDTLERLHTATTALEEARQVQVRCADFLGQAVDKVERLEAAVTAVRKEMRRVAER